MAPDFFNKYMYIRNFQTPNFSQTDSSCQRQLVINVQHMICTKSFSASFYSDHQLHHLLLTSFFFFFSRRDDFENQSQYIEWLKKYEDSHMGKYR